MEWTRWFSMWWYKYLFEPMNKYYSDSWWTVIKCRIKGHPCGMVWYNPGGSEPDNHCKNCGDDLG